MNKKIINNIINILYNLQFKDKNICGGNNTVIMFFDIWRYLRRNNDLKMNELELRSYLINDLNVVSDSEDGYKIKKGRILYYRKLFKNK